MDGLQDNKFNIRLVKCVKKYPLLYNTDLKEYTRRDCRERAWIDVAEELDCDPKAAQKKWQNFRSILVRKLKQMQMGESVQQYYLYDHMKYIIPYLKKTYEPGALKRTVRQIDVEPDAEYGTGSEHSTENIEINEDLTVDSHDPIYLENNEPNEKYALKKIKVAVSSEDEGGPEFDNDVVSNSPQSELRENIMVNNKMTNSTLMHAASTPVTYSEQRDQTMSRETPKRQFVLSLLPDLNEMTNSQMRQFKFRVLQLIDEILNENNT
ncbi:uncharacterized protein LOC126760666 isoform X1 [Bactrocera neohumeralis]|uniref:uncharacterized protein LOC120774358 isoform X1 n=1 Tax=Bactrocera tryoni TaxID=59916 RepID=UPI001A99F730|nr:uncharacterized protein LOC120774358 isoform X1 [Bactrocera tryoni]XP_050332438.1 uncharacterized protein LOC126760666 isoform X1 [Bactrocera neohumeralis]